ESQRVKTGVAKQLSRLRWRAEGVSISRLAKIRNCAFQICSGEARATEGSRDPIEWIHALFDLHRATAPQHYVPAENDCCRGCGGRYAEQIEATLPPLSQELPERDHLRDA